MSQDSQQSINLNFLTIMLLSRQHAFLSHSLGGSRDGGQVSLPLGIVTFKYYIIVWQVLCACNHRYISVSLSVCLCVCVCTCLYVGVRGRERERKRKGRNEEMERNIVICDDLLIRLMLFTEPGLPLTSRRYGKKGSKKCANWERRNKTIFVHIWND